MTAAGRAFARTGEVTADMVRATSALVRGRISHDSIGGPTPERSTNRQPEKDTRYSDTYGECRASQHKLQLLEPTDLQG